MDTIIRKISVGKDYPNGAIHYQVGSVQNLKRNKYEIVSIVLDRDLLERTGQLSYNIYIKNVPTSPDTPVSVRLWKTISGVPVVTENNIDFD